MSSKLIELDYEKLGMMCGIEIHQQLEGKKLYCDSPTVIRDDEPDYVVSRKLRAVIGETGKLDPAAKKEMAKGKTYFYQGYTDTIGLVELDEEPPHAMNQQALNTCIQVSKLLNAELVDEAQIMRKTVVDGSNTSGFQRTSLIGQHGYLTTAAGKRINIPTVIVEEDACKKVEAKGNTVIYNLSRLGIPLIEIATDPDISNPQEAKEVAAKLGMILRSTGKVKRGLGTIRQDVNVSIKGGRRVEIKGAQDLAGIPTLMDYEIIRQQNLIALSKTIEKNQIQIGEIVPVTDVFAETESPLIKKGLSGDAGCYAVTLTGASGVVGSEIQPGKRVGTDLSDFAKVHAGTKGLIHGDEDHVKKYGLSEDEVNALKGKLKLSDSDSFLLIVAPEVVAKKAFAAIDERLHLLKTGVPMEVRKANPDYTSTYMRPMPGEARMYPETDAMPVLVNGDAVELPELIDAKAQRFIDDYKLGVDLADSIAKGMQSDLFESLAKQFSGVKTATIAETLESLPKTLKRKDKIEINPTVSDYETVFGRLAGQKIAISALGDIFKLAHTKECAVADVISQFELMSEEDVAKIIDEVLAANKDAPMGAIMGQVMGRTKGRADGRVVQELIKKRLR